MKRLLLLFAVLCCTVVANAQTPFEEKVKGVFNTLGTKQNGPAIEIVGKDRQTIRLYNIKNVRYIKVNEKLAN